MSQFTSHLANSTGDEWSRSGHGITGSELSVAPENVLSTAWLPHSCSRAGFASGCVPQLPLLGFPPGSPQTCHTGSHDSRRNVLPENRLCAGAHAPPPVLSVTTDESHSRPAFLVHGGAAVGPAQRSSVRPISNRKADGCSEDVMFAAKPGPMAAPSEQPGTHVSKAHWQPHSSCAQFIPRLSI